MTCSDSVLWIRSVPFGAVFKDYLVSSVWGAPGGPILCVLASSIQGPKQSQRQISTVQTLKRLVRPCLSNFLFGSGTVKLNHNYIPIIPSHSCSRYRSDLWSFKSRTRCPRFEALFRVIPVKDCQVRTLQTTRQVCLIFIVQIPFVTQFPDYRCPLFDASFVSIPSRSVDTPFVPRARRPRFESRHPLLRNPKKFKIEKKSMSKGNLL